MPRAACLASLTFLLTAGLALGQTPRDGQRFDPGATMTARSPAAPPALDRMAFFTGQWDVAYQTFQPDGASSTASGFARVTYVNRGHGFLERFHCDDFDGDGHALDTATLLAFNTTAQAWNMGVMNHFTENAALYHGDFDGDALVLKNAVRQGGGATLTHYRATFKHTPPDGFVFDLETSTDDGNTWTPTLRKTYTRRAPTDDFMAASSTYGAAAPGLPEEARRFDFLIGTWDALQEIALPNGQTVQFPSITTAVYALNGHAILEYGWYDVDPQWPESATTILRIYNRAMRRWECLYMTNRGNGILYFGGVLEGDRLVLHLFETHTAAPSFSYFVFHDIEPDRYRWYAETTTDRGATFRKTWLIDVTRKEEPASE